MTVSESASELAAILDRYGLDIPPAVTELLAQYCRLLWKWNAQLNLTRHTTYELFAQRDLEDTRRLAALLNEREHVVDLGSGGGVPGLLAKILRPDLRMELCECVGKKARVLEEIRDALHLDLPVHTCKIEEVLATTKQPFDTIVARGVGSLEKMLRWLKPHWSKFGRLLVIKGPKWVAERGAARHVGLLRDLELRRVATYQPPGVEWESVILQLRPK